MSEPRTIQLTDAEAWELRALVAERDLVLNQADQARMACLLRLGQIYGFDVSGKTAVGFDTIAKTLTLTNGKGRADGE